MTHTRSFKEYISDRFYNELYTAADNVINRDWDSFNIACNRLSCPGNPEIEDVTVEYVWVNDEPSMMTLISTRRLYLCTPKE